MTTIEDRTGLATLAAHGYGVERWGCKGWLLLDADGSQLMVGDHGGVSPTRWEAIAEGLRRIGEDARHAAELRAVAKAGRVCDVCEAGANQPMPDGEWLCEVHARMRLADAAPKLRCYCPGDCGCRQHGYNARVTS